MLKLKKMFSEFAIKVLNRAGFLALVNCFPAGFKAIQDMFPTSHFNPKPALGFCGF